MPEVSKSFSISDQFIGGYSDNDGTIEFFGRIKSQCHPDSIVLDLGAGRGEWFEDGKCAYRRKVRNFKGEVGRYVAIDIDPVVLNNRSTDMNMTYDGLYFPFENEFFDIIFSDYVLEHVAHPTPFVSEVFRCLKPGGLFAARTPHKLNYVSVAAALTESTSHAKYLRFIQPNRKSEDVFSTVYKLNTLGTLSKFFSSQRFDSYSYLYRVEPAYYWGSRHIFIFQKWLHRIMPAAFSGHIYAFFKKKE